MLRAALVLPIVVSLLTGPAHPAEPAWALLDDFEGHARSWSAESGAAGGVRIGTERARSGRRSLAVTLARQTAAMIRATWQVDVSELRFTPDSRVRFWIHGSRLAQEPHGGLVLVEAGGRQGGGDAHWMLDIPGAVYRQERWQLVELGPFADAKQPGWSVDADGKLDCRRLSKLLFVAQQESTPELARPFTFYLDDLEATDVSETQPVIQPASNDSTPAQIRPKLRGFVERERAHPAQVTFADLSDWEVHLYGGMEATLERSEEEPLFERYSAKLTYHSADGGGWLALRPKTPIPLPGRFDALQVWVFGNTWDWVPDPATPQVDLAVTLRDATGQEHRLSVGRVNFRFWGLFHKLIQPDPARDLGHLAWGGAADGVVHPPAAFTGIEVRNCGNQQPRVIYLDSVAAYEEGPQIPQFQPVPARLPFPTTPETILPPVRDSGVVAWVNGVAITRAELHAELERSQGRAVLETLILRRLSLERARAVGVLPTADEVQSKLSETREQNGLGDEAGYRHWLRANALDEGNLADQILAGLAMDRLRTMHLKPTEAELKAFYDECRGQLFDRPERVTFRQIVLPTREDADKLLRSLNSGEITFREAAKMSIDEHSRETGGLADEVPLEVLQQQVPPLYNVLLRLKENQLCQQPVVVKDFFVIVKLLKRFPAERSDYRNERTRKEVRARYLQSNAIPEEQVLKELHVGAEVMVLDDRYRAAIESEFPASAAHRPVPVAAAHTAVEPDSPVNEVALAQIGNRWHWTCRAGGETIEYDYVPRTGTLSDLTVRQGEVSFKPADGAGLTWETGGESYGPADPRVTRRLLSARFDRDAVRTCWRLSVGGASVEYFLTLRAKGKSLIHEWRCTAPQMTGLSLGRAAGLTDGRLFMVPYYTVAGQGGAGILYDRGVYASHLLDWYVTDASHFYGGAARVSEHEVSYNGGCGYARLTDGTRNPLHERGFLTVSRRFEDVLPTIPNPPSPLTSVLRDYMYTHLGGTAPNRFDVWLEQFKRYRRYGIDKLIVTQHEDSWTQGADVGQGPEEYTMTVDGPPDAGGDSTLLRYYAGLRELGYYVGPYNNYTDYSPLGKSWAEENVTRLPDGEWQRVWPPCFNIRPLKAAEMQAHYAPAQHAKFGVNAQYCDVHTCIPPWADVDYQAGTPGAGKLRTTFESYGRLLMNNRPAYGGPSFSEGTHHVFYAGLVDGSYAQMGLPDPPSQPLLVDFDLRRLHPQGADLSMLPGAYWNDDEYDCMSATIAYGHAGFFPASGIPQACRYYYLVGALQREYVQVPVRDIGYWDGAQFVGISDALPRDVNRRGQLRVVYQSGLTVWVNRNAAPWDLAAEVPGLQLTQHGWLATHGDGFLTWSTRLGGRRLNYARCAAYTFAEAGGEWHDFGDLATDGEVCLRRDAEGGPRLIAIAGMTRAAVPAGAGVTRVLASDESGKPLGEVKYARDGGRIVFEAVAGAVNYDLR